MTITRLPTRSPPDSPIPPAHHVGGDPPTSFRNPWPSAAPPNSFRTVLATRFGSERNFVPVPTDRDELVAVRTPDWGNGKEGLKATWIGHASFLVETSAPGLASGARGEEGEGKDPEERQRRGVRILLDPVFSERTSPSQWFGPKRYTPPPCRVEELPEVDVVVVSHDHYDHLDAATIKEVDRRGNGRVKYLCGLGNRGHFEGMGVPVKNVVEMDWWDRVEVAVGNIGKVTIACTPAQHFSGRAPWNMASGLWCSWVIEDHVIGSIDEVKKLYFAGDTGYRARPSPEPQDLSPLPYCPAFSQIGHLYGPFNLALLPIGLYSPPSFMSTVHCAPEDSVCIHKDIKSQKSIGMHWGTVRGGLSAHYEDVREPPKRWRDSCEKAGLVWNRDIGLCDIGETTVV
ncbi:MAG: hypothetical protein M1822_008349 [Bathelium mastoideum]|nr:MAG: hypothetical protein M1822_008349 [Bathelium mastoideum]